MFFRKKKLFEHDPKTLDLDMLSHLQASLVAKLILVNEELRTRYGNLSGLSDGLVEAEKSSNVFERGGERLEKFNAYLNQELNRITGRGDGET